MARGKAPGKEPGKAPGKAPGKESAKESAKESGAPGPKKKAIKVEWVGVTPDEVQYRHQYDSGMWVVDPARAEFTAMGGRKLAALSLASNLGTERPPKGLFVPNADRTHLYLIPVKDHPVALKLKYNHGRITVNLVTVFTALDRLLQVGSREFYELDLATEPAEFEGVEYQALVMPLKRGDTKWEKTVAQKAEAQAKAEAKKAEKAARRKKPAQNPPENPGAAQPPQGA